jgi:hypothetical protein
LNAAAADSGSGPRQRRGRNTDGAKPERFHWV